MKILNAYLRGPWSQVQTEKAKLLGKALACSDPPAALRLLGTLGLDVRKELAKAGLELPKGFKLL